MISTSKIKTENCVTVIPRRFTMLRYISLPSHSDQEIEKMVGLQVIQQVPYPKEDIVLDYAVLNKDSSGYSKVLVIVVHKEVISRYLKIFSDGGLNVNKLALSSDGLLHWFLYQESRERQKSGQSVALINIDATDTEIGFIDRQKLLFSRSIHFGAKDLITENISAFVNEVDLTMTTYMKEKIGPDASKILLVSSGIGADLLKEKLQKSYNTTVEIVNPMNYIRQKRKLCVPLSLEKDGISMAVGLGLILAGKEKLINLLPREIASTRKTKQERLEWIKLIVLLLLSFGLFTLASAIRVYKDSAYFNELKSAINNIQPGVDRIKEKQRRLEFIKQKIGPSTLSIDIIYELYNITPKDVSFNLLSLSNDKSLTLQGISQSSSAVNMFQNNLVKSPLFENVNLEYATKRKVFKGEFTDFKITCQVFWE